MRKKLGNFENVIEISSMKFLVRGLSVGEYLDLVSKEALKSPEFFFKLIGLTCIIDWEGVYEVEEFDIEKEELTVVSVKYQDIGGELEPIYIDFSEDNLEELDDTLLFYIGKTIYYKYSILTKEEAERYQAFARWMYYASEDKHDIKNDIDSFDCEKCITDGLYKERPCGLTEDERNIIKAKLEEENKIDIKEDISNNNTQNLKETLTNKLPFHKFRKAFFNDVKEEKDENKENFIYRDFYKYKECPTSFITPKVRSFAEKIYFAHKSNMPFFDGGMINQDNKFTQICQTINSECNKIESERMKREQEESRKKAKK